jgi:predicted PurR-regulated permease PerM
MFTDKFIFWTIIVTFLGSFFYSIHAVLLPFVIAFLLSYFLNPLVNYIEKKGIPRTLSTFAVLGCFIFIITFIIITIIPLVREQLFAFGGNIPKYSKFIVEVIVPKLHERINSLNPYIAEKVKEAMQDSTTSFFAYITDFISQIFKSGLAIVHILSLIFISPIICFYALRDWNNAFIKLYNLFPVKHKKTIIDLLGRIDNVLANFIRGQTTVCLFLAIFYSISLTIIGLDFGLFIGIITGFLCFIPYVGALTGATIAAIVATIQFASIKGVATTLLVFGIGQFIEGNFITPKIVGDKVGLHPVMIFLGLFSGGILLGFVGVLFAIPIAATVGVVVQFLVGIYKQSTYYKG